MALEVPSNFVSVTEWENQFSISRMIPCDRNVPEWNDLPLPSVLDWSYSFFSTDSGQSEKGTSPSPFQWRFASSNIIFSDFAGLGNLFLRGVHTCSRYLAEILLWISPSSEVRWVINLYIFFPVEGPTYHKVCVEHDFSFKCLEKYRAFYLCIFLFPFFFKCMKASDLTYFNGCWCLKLFETVAWILQNFLPM